MEIEVETNVQEEQVETTDVTEEVQTSEEENTPSTNAEETVSQDDAYDKAFDEIDLDNPDMSMFAESTNVMEEPTETVTEEVVEENKVETIDPFSVDEDGYLVNPLVDRGREVKVTPEELLAFGNKGLNYEAKNAELKQYKEYINVLKENKNISIEDLASLADLSNGNKDALKHLISKYEVDVFDVDSSEEQYTPDTDKYNSDPVADLWSDFQKQNPNDSEVVATAFNSMDESFRQEVYNEKTFPLFADDVKRGVFDKLYPEAQKIKSLYPDATWLQAYSEANNRLSNKTQKKVIPQDVKPPKDKNPSSTASASSKADRIWDDPDAFDEMMKTQLVI